MPVEEARQLLSYTSSHFDRDHDGKYNYAGKYGERLATYKLDYVNQS